MLLNEKDRLLFPNLFPEKDSLINQILRRDIMQKVELSQKEMKEINCTVKDGVMNWDNNLGPKEVIFSKAELEYLKSVISNLDSKKEVSWQMVDLILKVKNEQNEQ